MMQSENVPINEWHENNGYHVRYGFGDAAVFYDGAAWGFHFRNMEKTEHSTHTGFDSLESAKSAAEARMLSEAEAFVKRTVGRPLSPQMVRVLARAALQVGEDGIIAGLKRESGE